MYIYGWGYTHDCHADKDSYPYDMNVTDDLFSLIKLCFAFIIVNFSAYVFYCHSCCKLFTVKSAWIIKKKMHNRHRPKREKQVIDHSTGDKN